MLYGMARYVAGSDGSVTQGDCMGYSNVWLDASLPTSYGAPEGRPSSQTSELAGILAAVSAPPIQEDVAVCTDSLSSLQMLVAMQREDFPMEIRTHPNFTTLSRIIQQVIQRAASGANTIIMKVTAHCGNPLNEWADEAAMVAFDKAENVVEHCLPNQFECLYQLPHGKGPPGHTQWSARIKRYSLQQAAEASLLKASKRACSGKDVRWSNAEAFLRREGENRSLLGSWLSGNHDPMKIRSILMACGEGYPCNAKLFQWKLRSSASCSLCHAPRETNCHIQCICPSLEDSRIKAHH